MGELSQPNYLGDWLKWEEDNRYCRDVKTVLTSADLPSGQVLGTESVFSKTAPYDNSNPAAATCVLVEPIVAEPAQKVTSIVNLSTTGTVLFPEPHGLAVGDIVKVSGATVDTDLNCNSAVATVPDEDTITITTASVSNATYTETTIRVTKLNHEAAVLVRGPALINANGLNFGASDSTGITAGLADLKALGAIELEGE